MKFETAIEEIKYLLRKIIFIYTKNITTTKIHFCHNSTYSSMNKILIRCNRDSFINQYVKDLFPIESIHKCITRYPGWFLIEFGVKIKNLEYLKPMTAYEATNLLRENPIRFFATFDLCLLNFWLPMRILSYVGVDQVNDEDILLKELNKNERWEWTGDVYCHTQHEFTLKILRTFVHSLSIVEEHFR